ncbi:AraC family transcriptional regulator [Faecalimonas canis]
MNGKKEIIEAGHMILYKPREMQRYVYYGTDQTEVYWVHFTGNNVKNILREYHLFESGQIIQTGNSTEYHQIFRKMIQELQLTRPHYEEYLSLLLRELFLLISRQAPMGISSQNRMLQKEMEEATQYFNEHFAEEISIEQYAMDKHLSISWFIRSFKRYNSVTPMQYILNLRITNAKTLLRTTTYSVSEVASIVGYNNPLYFSRLFKKQTGLRPSEFRNNKI